MSFYCFAWLIESTDVQAVKDVVLRGEGWLDQDPVRCLIAGPCDGMMSLYVPMWYSAKDTLAARLSAALSTRVFEVSYGEDEGGELLVFSDGTCCLKAAVTTSELNRFSEVINGASEFQKFSNFNPTKFQAIDWNRGGPEWVSDFFSAFGLPRFLVDDFEGMQRSLLEESLGVRTNPQWYVQEHPTPPAPGVHPMSPELLTTVQASFKQEGSILWEGFGKFTMRTFKMRGADGAEVIVPTVGFSESKNFRMRLKERSKEVL